VGSRPASCWSRATTSSGSWAGRRRRWLTPSPPRLRTCVADRPRRHPRCRRRRLEVVGLAPAGVKLVVLGSRAEVVGGVLAAGARHARTVRPDPSTLGTVGERGSRHEGLGRPPKAARIGQHLECALMTTKSGLLTIDADATGLLLVLEVGVQEAHDAGIRVTTHATSHARPPAPGQWVGPASPGWATRRKQRPGTGEGLSVGAHGMAAGWARLTVGRDRWRRAGLVAPGFRAGLAAAGWAVVAGTVGRAVQRQHGGHLPSDGSHGSEQSGAHHQAAAPAVMSGQVGSG
jgi:hypothetical protein